MPETIGKGITLYISALKDTAPLAAQKKPIEPLSRQKPAPLKSLEVAISKKARYRSREERVAIS